MNSLFGEFLVGNYKGEVFVHFGIKKTCLKVAERLLVGKDRTDYRAAFVGGFNDDIFPFVKFSLVERLEHLVLQLNLCF